MYGVAPSSPAVAEVGEGRAGEEGLEEAGVASTSSSLNSICGPSGEPSSGRSVSSSPPRLKRVLKVVQVRTLRRGRGSPARPRCRRPPPRPRPATRGGLPTGGPRGQPGPFRQGSNAAKVKPEEAYLVGGKGGGPEERAEEAGSGGTGHRASLVVAGTRSPRPGVSNSGGLTTGAGRTPDTGPRARVVLIGSTHATPGVLSLPLPLLRRGRVRGVRRPLLRVPDRQVPAGVTSAGEGFLGGATSGVGFGAPPPERGAGCGVDVGFGVSSCG